VRARTTPPGSQRGVPVTTRSRFDTDASALTSGLTNARARIVGDRTGFLADLLVTLVRVGKAARRLLGTVAARVATVVTPLGWTMAILAPFSLVAGYLLGWEELIVLGFAGLVLLIVAGAYLIGRLAHQITLTVPHSRVVVGDAAAGRVEVHNPTRHRLLGVTVEVPVGHGLAEIAMPSLAGGASEARDFAIPTHHRGVISVGPVRTVRADPVGLVRREISWSDRAELFVHPRTIGLPSTSTGLIHDLEGNPTRDLTSSDIAFHALREYTPGDERRHIHWRSTAKTGTYMVRQFEQTRRSHLMIALSLAAADYANDDEFELAVSVTGSLGVRAIRDSRDVSVVVSERTPEFAKRRVVAVRALSMLSRSRLLDELAVIERGESFLPLSDLARVSAATVSGVSVAFLVVGSTPTAGALRAAATRFPPGVEVIVIVCDPAAVPGLRRVPGLSIFTIGYLEDLQKALARSRAVA
jgi:uncharacterized protein (DUF58 family)